MILNQEVKKWATDLHIFLHKAEMFLPMSNNAEEEELPGATDENIKAATRLQAMQRGKQARKERQEQIEAANKIGAIHRGRKARKERREQAEAARKMQAITRGRRIR